MNFPCRYYLKHNVKRIVLGSLLFLLFVPLCISGNAQTRSAYQIKAGFLYKFLFFVEWPDVAPATSENEIVVAILGEDPFGNAFNPVEGQLIDGKELVIRRFETLPPPIDLVGCRLIFISNSLKPKIKEIIRSLEDYPILTVSEVTDFLDAGGMINFIIKEDRVRFEINQRAADRVGMKFRSKLLRVADRIISAGHDDG